MGQNGQIDTAELLARVDLVAVVQSRGIKLERRGSEYVGLCPWHKEKTGSFTVSPAKQFVHCFGCGAHTDAIGLVMKLDGVEFKEACARLDGGAGQPGQASPQGHEKPRDDDWQPIAPPGEAPDSILWKPWKGLKPTAVYTYRDVSGALLFYVRRFEPAGERKQFHWLTWGTLKGKLGWQHKAPIGRPLYRLPELVARPTATVLVTEGEKACEAAQRLLPLATATTWPGGSKADKAVDLEPLRGRAVVLWPDADAPGLEVMLRLARRLTGVAASVKLISTDGYTDGFDAADLDQVTGLDMRAWLSGRLAAPPQEPVEPEPGVQPEAPGPTEADAQAGPGGGRGGGGGHGRPPWMQAGAGCHMDANNNPIANLHNALLGLRQDEALAGCLAYDDMLRAPVLLRLLPHKLNGEAFEARPVKDEDVGDIQDHLQIQGMRRLGKDTTHQAVDIVAREHSYHPVRDYLKSTVWDGTPRVLEWLIKYLGVASSQYAEQIGMMFLISMVARVQKPGCQCDYMLVLEGVQGDFKSSACRILGGKWFSENLPEVTAGKDVAQHLNGKWLIEANELASLSRVETERLKGWLTITTERYRPSYGRKEVIEPRQCCFVGTTNKDQYLKDETGNRRYWPVKVGAIDLDGLERDRDQLFAEAMVLYLDNHKWWPDKAFEAAFIKPEQDERFEVDAWEEKISEYLRGDDPKTNQRRVRTSVYKVAREGLLIDAGRIGRPEQLRIIAILSKMGWWKGRKEEHERPWFAPVT